MMNVSPSPQGAAILVGGCRREDVALLRRALGPGGPLLRDVGSPIKVPQEAASRRPLAVILGVGPESSSTLEVIPVVQAVAAGIPVIVIGEDDSLPLERSARSKGIFYYLVLPLAQDEVKAVFEDVLRRACR